MQLTLYRCLAHHRSTPTMVRQSLKSFSFESKLNEDESNYQRAAAKNYLNYFGNRRPSIEQLNMMQSLIDSHWLKRTVKFNNKLTEREKECLLHIIHGKNKSEIALLMNISAETIKIHTRNILKKMVSKNTKEAIAKALRYELIKNRCYFE